MPPRPIKTLTSFRGAGAYRGAAAAAAVALTLTVSGCATGFNAETNREYTPAVGTNVRESGIVVLNALFVENGDGSATLSTVLLDEAGEGDTLTGVTVSSDDGAVDATIEEPVELETGVNYSVGEEPNVIIRGDFIPGQFLRTTLTFQQAGEISFRAVVVRRTEEYREVAAPSIVPSATPSASGSTDEPSDEPSASEPTETEPTS